MINAGSIIEVDRIYEDGKSTIIKVAKPEYFDEEQYDLSYDKDFKHYVDDVERIVRNSFEYRNMINYLKNTTGMDECSILENVTSRNNSGVRIELHHSPLTLYDICLAVIKKRMANNEDMNVNAVAYEIMYCHFAKWVGLIPLSFTPHELVHNAYFFVPTDRVFGDYRPFVNQYYNYIAPDTLDALDSAEEATKNYDGKQMEMFNNHKLYVDVQNYDGSIVDLKPEIKQHIDNLKHGQPSMPVPQKIVMCRIVDNSKPRTY